MNRPTATPTITILLSIAIATILSACGGESSAPEPALALTCPPLEPCPACPVCPPPAATPEPGIPPAPPLQPATWDELAGWNEDELAQAWPALRASCTSLVRQLRWQSVCTAAMALESQVTESDQRQFFEQHFRPWRLVNADGSTEGLVTGYFEPLIKGSRMPSDRHAWPIHGAPNDLLSVDLANLYPELKNIRLRGRIDGNRIVPYWTRAEIGTLGTELPAQVLLWAADPIDLFFLHVQGSGQVELPDGSRVRIGYADHNGHPYSSIGRWLVAQGELPLQGASMQAIKDWARKHPDRVAEMMNANSSYVFFRELPSASGGPIGALGVPLTPGRSIAIDPRHVPLGAPVFLATTYPLSDRPLRRLMLAQDTGGAIKGVVRADFFWGFGDEAGIQAGKMRQQGRIWVLLPKEEHP